MATFLMIHGAWHGGWCFDPVRLLLEKSGHIVIAPTLPGIGGSARELAAVTLAGWGTYVAELAGEQDEPVILCGHSRGGIVISDAAERAPEAVRALVYISAFLVPDGKSMNAIVDSAPRLAEFETGLSLAAGGAALALSGDAAESAFYNACPQDQRAIARARLTPEPMAPLGTPLALTQARYGSVSRHYIECTQDRAIPLWQQRAMQEALPCASVITLESDHSPFMGCPEALADALERIAEAIYV